MDNVTDLPSNTTDNIEDQDVFSVTRWDDATWILTSAFIVFTMQSGFGLLESGSVSRKNEVNIMVKNAVDVLFGGLSYWMFGYGLSFGEDKGTNRFVGVGHFFVHSEYDGGEHDEFGTLYAHFFFHTSFATTATTIVSGAMAERTKLEAYVIFSFVNTLVYCMPAHWLWANTGWLRDLGACDIAGASTVHLVGGMTGLIATLIMGPRIGKFEDGKKGVEADAKEQSSEGAKKEHSDIRTDMSSPTNALLGTFMLW